MTEWVVTLRNGKRKEFEAESFMHFPEWIEFGPTRPVNRSWPLEQVVLVQRRDGHHLEQVWPQR